MIWDLTTHIYIYMYITWRSYAFIYIRFNLDFKFKDNSRFNKEIILFICFRFLFRDHSNTVGIFLLADSFENPLLASNIHLYALTTLPDLHSPMIFLVIMINLAFVLAKNTSLWKRDCQKKRDILTVIFTLPDFSANLNFAPSWNRSSSPSFMVYFKAAFVPIDQVREYWTRLLDAT